MMAPTEILAEQHFQRLTRFAEAIGMILGNSRAPLIKINVRGL